MKMKMGQIKNIALPLMRVIKLEGASILHQLHLEEMLLGTSSDNWKPAELLELDLVIRDHIPVIKRFTGGGTVIVDGGTMLVTFICNKDAVPGLQPYPRQIMSWSGLVYNEVFRGTSNFNLRENDYVFGNLKLEGNAQSITKNRWVHHTSFLWSFEEKNMSYLKHPAKVPEYRDYHQGRSHLEFICRMKDYVPRSVFIDKTFEALCSHFTVSSTPLEEALGYTDSEFVPSTNLLTIQDLQEALSASLST